MSDAAIGQAVADIDALTRENERLRRSLARERAIRREAEEIAERGLRQLYEEQRRLEFMEQIARTANQSGSVRDALERALSQIGRFAGWPAGHAYLVEGEEDERRLLPSNIWHHDDRLDLHRLMAITTRLSFDYGDGLPGRVWQRAAPEWIEDLANCDFFQRLSEALSCGLHSVVSFPLFIENEVVAVMEFFADRRAVRDAGLLRLVTQAGTQLGRVIERDRASDHMHDSLHDSLTGLPNRAHFLGRLEIAMRKRNGSYGPPCVLFIDLDHFKSVNDTLGHAAGDQLLLHVATRLRAAVRAGVDGSTAQTEKQFLLARLGGDEFTVLVRSADAFAAAVSLAARIETELRQSCILQGQDIGVAASIGIVRSTPEHRCEADLLRDADLAMYQAKVAGKGRTVLFESGMRTAALIRVERSQELQAALHGDAFVLHFQPLVSLHDGRLAGFEALVRWRVSPTVLRYPGEFLQVAEETGIIVPLGAWVMREACRVARRWQEQRAEAPPLVMSVNVSGRQFAQPDLVGEVARILTETRLDPGLLRIELTEAVAIDGAEGTIGVLRDLSALGVRLAIDDFGTGVSSLSILHRLPAQMLKIDRSFVSGMETSADSLQVIRSILNVARGIGLEVVAEGVETSGQLEAVRALGCDYFQGHAFAAPVPEQEADKLVQRRPRLLRRRSAPRRLLSAGEAVA